MPDKRKFPLSRFASQGLKKDFSLLPLKTVSECYTPSSFLLVLLLPCCHCLMVWWHLFYPSPLLWMPGLFIICCRNFALNRCLNATNVWKGSEALCNTWLDPVRICNTKTHLLTQKQDSEAAVEKFKIPPKSISVHRDAVSWMEHQFNPG